MSIQLLCHFDGTNGSTTITDETGNITNFICSGGAALSDTGETFGTACLLLNEGCVESSNSIVFGTNDFTYRLRYTPLGNDLLTGEVRIILDTTAVYLYLDSGVLIASINFDDSTFTDISLGSLTLNTSYAISVERYGNNFYAYLDGVLINQITDTKGIITGYPTRIGSTTAAFSGFGRVDELLIDIGTSYALGAASYTVETQPFYYYNAIEKELILLTTAPLIKSLEILITAPLVKSLDIIITAPIENGIIFINSANQSIEKELIIKTSANLPIEKELIIKTAAASLDIEKTLVIKTYAVDSNKNTMIRWNG